MLLIVTRRHTPERHPCSEDTQGPRLELLASEVSIEPSTYKAVPWWATCACPWQMSLSTDTEQIRDSLSLLPRLVRAPCCKLQGWSVGSACGHLCSNSLFFFLPSFFHLLTSCHCLCWGCLLYLVGTTNNCFEQTVGCTGCLFLIRVDSSWQL